MKELGEAHGSREAFEEALRQAYGEPQKCRGRREFDQWVASAKTHRGANKAFLEFRRRFVRVLKREQRLVGMDKFLLFVRSIDHAKQEVIGIELEEEDGANGLTEDWLKVKRVWRRLYRERSAKGKGKMMRDGAPS